MSQRDPRIWMLAEAFEMLERAERIQRHFFRPRAAVEALPAWEAPVDIFETDTDLWIVAALPGVDPADVRVVIDSGVLAIAGMRPLPAILRDSAIRRLEIPHGRFERRVELPRGRYEVAQSTVVDGCLHLRLRKL